MNKKNSADERTKALLELKQLLQEKKKSLVAHLKAIEEDTSSGLSEVGGDDADLANLEVTQSALTKLGNRERKLLEKIEYALAKFGEGDDTGTYGICEYSGEEIPVARLRARPEAQYTVEAKEEMERKEVTYRDKSDSASSMDDVVDDDD